MVCEVCGNEYERTFDVRYDGRVHVFDSFECAIHALAPRCRHCGCAIVGHGVQVDSRYFCCTHCATTAGSPGTKDHA